MNAFFSSPVIQVLIAATGLFGTYLVAKFNRAGSKEANQTTGWTNLVSALQKTNAEMEERQDKLEARIKEMDSGNRDLAGRVNRLEKSRRSWKTWGQRVVALMGDKGISLPETPESLEDTDPNLERTA